MGIMEFLILITIALLLFVYYGHRNRQRSKQEQELFALAIKKRGRLTTTEIVTNTTLNVAQTERVLSTMHKKGHIGIIQRSNMPSIYVFNDVPDQEERQPAPSTQKRFSATPAWRVKEEPVFEEDEEHDEEYDEEDKEEKLNLSTPKGKEESLFEDHQEHDEEEGEEDEEGDVNNLVRTINIASNAYRGWLPEVLEKLESYQRYPAAVALPKFKKYVEEKIASYEETEAESQARINEEGALDNGVYFLLNLALNFSSGPMVKVLMRIVTEIELWEANPEEIEAASVIDAIRQILNEEINAEK